MSFFIMLSTFKECYQNSSHVLKTKKSSQTLCLFLEFGYGIIKCF